MEEDSEDIKNTFQISSFLRTSVVSSLKVAMVENFMFFEFLFENFNL